MNIADIMLIRYLTLDLSFWLGSGHISAFDVNVTIVTLSAPTAHNGQTHSSNLSEIVLRHGLF